MRYRAGTPVLALPRGLAAKKVAWRCQALKAQGVATSVWPLVSWHKDCRSAYLAGFELHLLADWQAGSRL